MGRKHVVGVIVAAGPAALLLVALGCEPKDRSTEPESSPLAFDDETTRINYSLGYQIGGDFKRQDVELDADAVVQGIADALSGSQPKMSQPEMHETLVELKRKVVAEERERSGKRELELLEEGKRFLADNASKPGVVTTESGLQYRIIEPGTDKRPGPRDTVTCRYTGRLVNGNEVDSSKDEPATFPLDRVIPGWTEGLQLIGEGGKIELFIPQGLAYRDRGPLGHRTLIYEIELLSVVDN